MTRILTLAATLAAALSLAACNTVQGAGKDLNAAGNAISKTAKDVENSM